VEELQRIVASHGGRPSRELATAHHQLAEAYLAEGEKDLALEQLDLALEIDPGSIAVLRDLGVLSLEMAESGEEAARRRHEGRALKTFRALLLQRLDESAPISKSEVFYHLAEISHRQNDDRKALQMLERSLDANPDYAPAKELAARLGAPSRGAAGSSARDMEQPRTPGSPGVRLALVVLAVGISILIALLLRRSG
jgi:tetratricopeptide (TPR) repeat protein